MSTVQDEPIVDVPAPEKSKVDIRVEQWTQQLEQTRQRIGQLQQEIAHLQQQAVMIDGALQAYQCFIEDTTPANTE